MLTINPRDTQTPELHSYLLSAVAPRPIALASTIDEQGNPNLSPFSFFNVFSANPPILIFSPARRVRDNTVKHTYENAKAVKEVVINVVTHDMVQQTSLSSTEYDKGVNEFEKAGFSMKASERVKPFRVAESPVQFECAIRQVIELGSEGGAGNLIICEVLLMHIDESVLDANQKIDQKALDLVARAGGSYYSRAKEGFFEIPKPLRNKGVGVSGLPESVRTSSILTGNDLGLLGNVEQLPGKADVDKFMKDKPDIFGLDRDEKHKFAQQLIQKNDVTGALKVLLS
ncbi:MAG: flavin reductase family protein [Lutimonas sp.]